MSDCDELQKEIDEKLKDLFDKEKRFMSHLTIARVKSIKDKKEFFKKIREIDIKPIKFNINNFKLKESVLLEKGLRYNTLEEYKLN